MNFTKAQKAFLKEVAITNALGDTYFRYKTLSKNQKRTWKSLRSKKLYIHVRSEEHDYIVLNLQVLLTDDKFNDFIQSFRLDIQLEKEARAARKRQNQRKVNKIFDTINLDISKNGTDINLRSWIYEFFYRKMNRAQSEERKKELSSEMNEIEKLTWDLDANTKYTYKTI